MFFNIICWTVFLIYVMANANGADDYNIYESVNGQPGPYYWPKRYPECRGQAQSPINIQTSEAIYNADLSAFVFSMPSPPTKMVVENNGHTIQINTEGEFYVRRGGLQNVYSTAQLHFHWGDNDHHGSEHTINDVPYPLEMHIVNWNSDRYASIEQALKHSDGLAVLGVLFEISADDNPALGPILKAVRQVRDPDLYRPVELPVVPIESLIPKNARRFYRYQGSLTTPNCDESVIWTVFDSKLTISRRQLSAFRHTLLPSKYSQDQERKFLVNNYRPVQPLGERRVYKSFAA